MKPADLKGKEDCAKDSQQDSCYRKPDDTLYVFTKHVITPFYKSTSTTD